MDAQLRVSDGAADLNRSRGKSGHLSRDALSDRCRLWVFENRSAKSLAGLMVHDRRLYQLGSANYGLRGDFQIPSGSMCVGGMQAANQGSDLDRHRILGDAVRRAARCVRFQQADGGLWADRFPCHGDARLHRLLDEPKAVFHDHSRRGAAAHSVHGLGLHLSELGHDERL